MSSVTAELRDSESALFKWFQLRHSISAKKIIAHHNFNISQGKVIKPTGKIKDFSLIGMSFIYAFRWYLGILKQDNFLETPASYRFDLEIAKELFSAKTTEEKAIACLIFAAHERQYRTGNAEELATVLLESKKSQLKSELKYVYALIDDLSNLIDSIDIVWNKTNSSLTKHKYYLNPTFEGSEYIPGDGQQIVDGILIKCFTTLKKSPFTKQHLWQQIAYVLMDWNNEFEIDKVCWYYPRQKALFIYPIDSLFKDLEGLRKEFQAFVMDNYELEITMGRLHAYGQY